MQATRFPSGWTNRKPRFSDLGAACAVRGPARLPLRADCAPASVIVVPIVIPPGPDEPAGAGDEPVEVEEAANAVAAEMHAAGHACITTTWQLSVDREADATGAVSIDRSDDVEAVARVVPERNVRAATLHADGAVENVADGNSEIAARHRSVSRQGAVSYDDELARLEVPVGIDRS